MMDWAVLGQIALSVLSLIATCVGAGKYLIKVYHVQSMKIITLEKQAAEKAVKDIETAVGYHSRELRILTDDLDGLRQELRVLTVRLEANKESAVSVHEALKVFCGKVDLKFSDIDDRLDEYGKVIFKGGK